MDEGFAVNLAANTEYRAFPGGTQDLPGFGAYGIGPGVSVEMRNGFNERVGIFGRLGVSYGPSLKAPEGHFVFPLGVDFNVGVKLAPVASGAGAFRFAFGLPNLIEGSYLVDLGEHWTLNAGAGLPCGAFLGVACHIPVSENATIHIAAEGSDAFEGYPPAVSLGVALGLPR